MRSLLMVLVLLSFGLLLAAEARAQSPELRMTPEPPALAPAGPRAQDPKPGQAPGPPVLEAAFRQLDAGHYDEALESFEWAARERAAALPPDALRGWGVAAFEAGRPLAAYVRLRQYLASVPQAPDQAAVEDRIGRARESLVASAARFSRLLASLERRPDEQSAGEHHLARVAARDGEVSLESLSGARIEAPLWRRAEEIPLGPYLGFLRQLLESPALVEDAPRQAFDANAPGPRRAAVVRVVIGEEERRVEALRGEPYDRVRALAESVMAFARSVPPAPDSEAQPAEQHARPRPAIPPHGKRR